MKRCRKCEHWMLDEDVCPECGEPVSVAQKQIQPAIEPSSSPQLKILHFNPYIPEGLQLARVLIRSLIAAEVHISFNAKWLEVEVPGGGKWCRASATDGDATSFFAECQFSTAGVVPGTHRIEMTVECRHGRRVERRYIGAFPFLVPPPKSTVDDINKILRAHQIEISDRYTLDLRDTMYLNQLRKSKFASPEMTLTVATWEGLLTLDSRNSEGPHPCQCFSACIRSSGGGVKHIRLFALPKFILGRLEDFFDGGKYRQEADILLAACPGGKPDKEGLTWRISGSHMIISIHGDRWQLVDVSKLGTLVDGQPVARGHPITLWPGQRISLTWNAPGVMELNVRATTPQALYLERSDAGSGYEMLVLLAPNINPDLAQRSSLANMPVFMHSRGGFWMLGGNDEETPLLDGMEIALEDKQATFVTNPYPDLHLDGYKPGAALRNEKN